MGKLAFVFSGQGDQYPGMGKELAEKYPVAAAVYEMCDRLRPGTSAQCFAGTEEELKETGNTQPCLFAVELAAARVLEEKGILPHAVAGFSLGEMVAATVSGIFDEETGFRLVCRRGQLMQQEAERADTQMAVVLKLTVEQVQRICDSYSDMYAVNFNCPGQITVSGLSSQMPEFAASVKAEGGRLLPLKVQGAFHSPFMKKAAAAFAEELEKSPWKKGEVPLYSNLTGGLYTKAVPDLLSRQICSPVQWEGLIHSMLADGIDTFVEIGPGRTLVNLIRRIHAGTKAYPVAEYLELC